jgi:hypothetical protein
MIWLVAKFAPLTSLVAALVIAVMRKWIAYCRP